jgi:hypothetical protein
MVGVAGSFGDRPATSFPKYPTSLKRNGLQEQAIIDKIPSPLIIHIGMRKVPAADKCRPLSHNVPVLASPIVAVTSSCKGTETEKTALDGRFFHIDSALTA